MGRKLKLMAMALGAASLIMVSAYAAWQDKVTVNTVVTTGKLSWTLINNLYSSYDTGNDWICDQGLTNVQQTDRDVSNTTITACDTNGDGDLDQLVVTVNKAYPGYYNEISCQVLNNGSIPLKTENATFNTANPEAFEFNWLQTAGVVLTPGKKTSQSFEFCVTNQALQGHPYTFTMNFPATQWNAGE